ncbi:MAG TPA: hypothetical protein VGA56_04660 [Opitutaceae bacterium]
MRARFAHLLLLFAWLLATGSQWDVVQVFAWSRMFAQNARLLPTWDALELTFSPDGQCGLCHLVEDSRQERPGDNAAAGKAVTKEPIVFLTAEAVFVQAPTSMPGIEPEQAATARDRSRPPTPPPRALAPA